MQYLGDAPGHKMLNGILKLEDVARQILNPLEMQEFLAARTKDLANVSVCTCADFWYLHSLQGGAAQISL